MSESREYETLCVDDNEVCGGGGFRCLGEAAPSVAERSGHTATESETPSPVRGEPAPGYRVVALAVADSFDRR